MADLSPGHADLAFGRNSSKVNLRVLIGRTRGETISRLNHKLVLGATCCWDAGFVVQF